MIQARLTITLAIFVWCACQSERDSRHIMKVVDSEVKYKRYDETLVIKEGNKKLRAERYSLDSHSAFDSTVLSEVYIPLPFASGKFNVLSLKKAELENIILPGKAQAFVGAGTLLFLNILQNYYIVQGKAWIKTGERPATIKADEIYIQLAANSAVNVDNYPNDSNIIVSITEGHAKIFRYTDSVSFSHGWELLMDRKTGKIKTRSNTIDVTSWTNGGLRRWGVDFTYHMNDVGRVYNKNVYVGDLTGLNISPLNYNYQNATIEQVVVLYNTNYPEIKMELKGDSLLVQKR